MQPNKAIQSPRIESQESSTQRTAGGKIRTNKALPNVILYQLTFGYPLRSIGLIRKALVTSTARGAGDSDTAGDEPAAS